MKPIASNDRQLTACGHSEHELTSDEVYQLLSQEDRVITVNDNVALCPSAGDYYVFGSVDGFIAKPVALWLNDGHQWRKYGRHSTYKDGCLLFLRTYYVNDVEDMCRVVYTSKECSVHILIHYITVIKENNNNLQHFNININQQRNRSVHLPVCVFFIIIKYCYLVCIALTYYY